MPAGCFPPGAHVEVLWPAPEETWEGRPLQYFEAKVVSVHADGRYVVQYRHWGKWGDTERGVHWGRLRTATLDQGGSQDCSSMPEQGGVTQCGIL